MLLGGGRVERPCGSESYVADVFHVGVSPNIIKSLPPSLDSRLQLVKISPDLGNHDCFFFHSMPTLGFKITFAIT